MMNEECGMRNKGRRVFTFIHHSSFRIPHFLGYWIAFLAIFVAGCSVLNPPIRTLDYRNPELDFNKYMSYAINSPPEEDNDNIPWIGLKNQIYMEMQERGYRETNDLTGADLWVILDYSASFQNVYNPIQPKQDLKEGDKKPETKFSGEHLYPHLALRFYDPKLQEYTWQSIIYIDSTNKLIRKSWDLRVIGRLTATCPYSGTYGGVGIKFDDSTFEIKELLAGSPAQAAGIMVGDIIQTINGVKITDYQQCVSMLKGKAGTRLKIVVGREDKSDPEADEELKPVELTLQRVPVNNFYFNRK